LASHSLCALINGARPTATDNPPSAGVIAVDGGADGRCAGIDNIAATAADDGEDGQAPGLDVLAAAGHDLLIAVPLENIAGLRPAQNLVDQVFAIYVVKNLMK
jgi:hypothetical protein